MFEFTKRSRKVLEIMSQSEARRLNSELIEPDHIFISLLKDEDSVAARILKNLGVNFDSIIPEIEQSIRRDKSILTLGKIPPSVKYKNIIEISKDEARKLKNSYIGTEHLLLAIIRDGTSAGLDTLLKSGIDYSVIRTEILRVLGIKINSDKVSRIAANKVPSLDEFARDLTKMAMDNQLDPVIGRDEEITRVIRILSRKRKNNPILIGEAGVGKTAIVEGLAQRIIKKSVPEPLMAKRVLSLDIAAIVAGTKYRGEFEERLKRVINEIARSDDIIIFIDEVHTIIGAGAAEGAIDAANILKPALARGELQCIGATTLNEYKLYVEKDTALARRFQSVLVEEPDMEQTIQILFGLKERFESHHKVHFMDDALISAAILSERYINDRFLPDKAIDIIDEAGALARLADYQVPPDIDLLSRDIDDMNEQKGDLVQAQEYEKAAALRDMIHEKKQALSNKLKNWQDRKEEYAIVVTPEHIATIISEITGIPVRNIEETESEKLLRLEEELHLSVIGQDDAVSAVCRAIRRARTGLSSHERPRGAFIFLGPTGVGKTELAKALAAYIFDDDKSLIRIDMSEYMEKHTVSRLIGAPPGYIGYEEGGQLTEKIKRRPYSVILFDEIEKAHPEVFNILLQVLEEGELTDGSGTTVSFRDTIIIMTSNIGNREFQKSVTMGFGRHEHPDAVSRERVNDELKRIFSPEFINRLDEVVFFHRLDMDHMKKIVELLLDDLNKRIAEKEVSVTFTSKVKLHLVEKGFDEKYGARYLRRIIQNEVEDTLACELLRGGITAGSHLEAYMKGDVVHYRPKRLKKTKPRENEDGIEILEEINILK